jgi:hypothetical protein
MSAGCLRLFVAAVSAATAICLAGAAGAQATTTTPWYTIDVRPGSAASPHFFLAVHSRFDDSPIELTHYLSESAPAPGQYSAWADQQWTPVIPDYPATPDVTGGSAISDFLSEMYDAFTCRTVAASQTNPAATCGFHGRNYSPPVKFVNRGSGRCLSVFNWTRNGQGTTVVASRCRRNQSRQTWRFSYPYPVTNHGVSNAAEDYGDFSQTRSQNPGVRFCIDVGKGNAHDHRRAKGDHLQMWQCTSRFLHGNQEFRFLQVSEATCTTRLAQGVCGLQQNPG